MPWSESSLLRWIPNDARSLRPGRALSGLWRPRDHLARIGGDLADVRTLRWDRPLDVPHVSPRVKAPPAAFRNRILRSGEEAPDQLLANPANWRLHPGRQRDALRGSLSTVGWVQQVIVNERTGHLVDGHARVEEAISKGETSVPVLYVDLSLEEERLVLATLDPIGAMASTSDERLRELLADVTVDDEGLAALLEQLQPRRLGRTDPDDVPAVPDDPYVKPGELWLLGDHRLRVGDAANPEHVAHLLGGAEPTLLVTDPPLDPTWRDGVYNKLGPGAKPYMQMEGHHNKSFSGDTIVDWSPAFELVASIEVAYVWHAGVYAVEVGEGLRRLNFEIRSQIIWAKTVFAMGRGAYHWQHEPCWFAVRKGKTANWIGDHKLSTVWDLASPKMIMGGSTEEKFDHPAQKPIECMARPIANHAGEVYEPFLGSGTTLIAAEMHGRRSYSMEIDPRYAQVAIERWQSFSGKEARRE